MDKQAREPFKLCGILVAAMIYSRCDAYFDDDARWKMLLK